MNDALTIPATKTTALAAIRCALQNRMERAVCLVLKDGTESYIEHATVRNGQVVITLITGDGVNMDGEPTDTTDYTVDPQRPVTVTVKQNFWGGEARYGKSLPKRIERIRGEILRDLRKRHRIEA